MRAGGPGSESVSIPACGIAVMAKASMPGRTKTRLVPPLTWDEAAQCNTAFLRDVGDNMLAASARASIAAYMAFGPPHARSFFQENLPGEIGLIDAWYPNFGDCLACAIMQLLQRGHTGAVVLNSDSPTLPPALLVETAETLARPGDRVVLGPADDGGYYLLGVKAMHRPLFQDIAWSTEHVARQTLERAAELGLPVHILPKWYDVDDVRTLYMLQSELFEGRSFAPNLRPNAARHVRALMQSLLENSDFKDRLACAEFRRAAE
ncbi:MAG: TIGR04282 family arsenosugar biosynthesis glycosyltransferase [Xanthobacteraceae bacterium]